MKKLLLCSMAMAALSGMARAEDVAISTSAPDQYTVVKGDTLWDISSRFLKDPWRWPEIWQANPQIKNPHLIYPGDVVLLCQINGKNVLAIDPGGGCPAVAAQMAKTKTLIPADAVPEGGVLKLHPQLREQEVGLAIPALPLKEVQRYLNNSRVVTRDDLQAAPYVVAGPENRLLAGVGDRVFVRGKFADSAVGYSIYRPAEAYTDPDTGEVLGFEAEDVANVKVVGKERDIATVEVTRMAQDLRIEDRMLPVEQRSVTATYFPASPEGVKPGRVIHIMGGLDNAAKFGVVVINRGERDGAKAGQVFSMYRHGAVVKDRVSSELVRLPSEHEGLVMIFRPFKAVSYALVLRAERPIKVGDEARIPQSGDY